MDLFAIGNINWYLPPLIIAVSLVYGATRYEDWRLILQHAFLWSLYILSFLGVTYVVLLLVSWDIPKLYYIPILLAAGAAFYYSGRTKPKEETPTASA